MWKLDFYILPSKCYSNITEEDIENLDDKVTYINSRERLYVPNEIYDIRDIDQKTIADFLYNNEQSDLSDYLLEIISKQRICSDTYDMIARKAEYGYVPLTELDITENIAQVCVGQIKNTELEKCWKMNDIVSIKRFFIVKVNDYDDYENRVRDCFPHLVFHEEAFKFVDELGKCSDVIEELTRHLIILNDVGKKLYDYHNKNEREVLLELSSGYDLVCSGKGSNEEKRFNKEINYKDQRYQLTCNPHTKLYKKRTDKRIYFCWGRDEIEGHNIIIVRIGGHWQE